MALRGRGPLVFGLKVTLDRYATDAYKCAITLLDDFCYDPIPEIWSDIDTQSKNICPILIPNPRIYVRY